MRSSSFHSIGLVIGLLAVCAVGVQAASTSLAPDADSYVRASLTYAGQNYGSDTILAVKDNSNNASYNRVSFLRFQLGSFNEPISIAVLKLNCVSLTQGAATVDVYAVENDAWGEGAITWLNKPGLGAKLTSISVAATGLVKVPLHIFARQQQLGDGLLSIALVQPAGQNRYVAFASREAASGQPALDVSCDPPPPIGTGTGLLARIYDNPDLSARKLVRVDPKLDFNWGTGTPATGVGADTFSIQWQGQIQPRYTESYTIYTLSDDGVRLWIDGQLVIDNWTDHAVKEDKCTISLRAGQKYDIRADYYDNTGTARIALLWECLYQDKQVIPTTQLYPAEFLGILDVNLLTATESPVNPAWVEWDCSEDAAALRFSVNGGVEQDAVRESSTRCFGDIASALGLPYGIPLDQEHPTEVAITADDGAGQTKTTAHTLLWKPTKLNGKSWSEDEMVIRVNDSLLFTVESDLPGAMVALDADEDGTADYLGEAGMKFPFRYTVAGQYTVTAWLGEEECGTLTVTVLDADLKGPIACQLGYQREKFVAVSPTTSTGSVSFIANNPGLLGVSVKGSAVEAGVQGQKLYLKTLGRGTPVLQARLNGTTGPLVKQQEVDEFTLVTQATKFIGVVETFDDGSMLVQTNLEMSPKVENLGVTLNIFVSGVTFDDSTLVKTLNTTSFTLDAESGNYLYPYQMIVTPGIKTGTCHTIKVMQGSEQVGQ